MHDRARGPIQVSVLRVGRTDIGAGTAVLDEDALTVTVRDGGPERGLRLRLAQIDRVSLTGDDLILVLHDGTRVTVVASASHELSGQILGACRSLPEMTRTLRAFGSSRGQRAARESDARSAGAGEQARFFAPLMASRRNAGDNVSPTTAIEAFDAPALLRALDETLHEFASSRHGDSPPARRALEAELVDASEPLYLALKALGDAATEALREIDDLHRWRVWSRQLRATFEAADRVWLALDVVLAGAALPDATPS